MRIYNSPAHSFSRPELRNAQLDDKKGTEESRQWACVCEQFSLKSHEKKVVAPPRSQSLAYLLPETFSHPQRPTVDSSRALRLTRLAFRSCGHWRQLHGTLARSRKLKSDEKCVSVRARDMSHKQAVAKTFHAAHYARLLHRERRHQRQVSCAQVSAPRNMLAVIDRRGGKQADEVKVTVNHFLRCSALQVTWCWQPQVACASKSHG